MFVWDKFDLLMTFSSVGTGNGCGKTGKKMYKENPRWNSDSEIYTSFKVHF